MRRKARFDPMQILLCAVMVLYGGAIIALWCVTDAQVAAWLAQ